MRRSTSSLLALVLGAAVLAGCQSSGDLSDSIEDGAAWDRIEGSWDQFSGGVQERWGELTDDDVAELDGNKDQLIGKIQEKYGIARQAAADQVDEWAAAL